MNGHQWGAEGPHRDAYSRVTNPERFASLHDFVAELLDRLELEFDAERAHGYGLDPELERGCKLARPTESLVPRDFGAAPIVVSFSAFPGVRVRFGRWYIAAFPSCGCDACDETAESETPRLKSLIDNLTAGRFSEAIRIPLDGRAYIDSEFWSVGGRSAQHLQVDRDRARQLVDTSDRCSYDWGPWPRRR
jgi:Family of unknown function (DUF6226)